MTNYLSQYSHIVSIGVLVVILSAILQTVCVQTIESSASNLPSSVVSVSSVGQKIIKQDSNVPMASPMGDVASLDEWVVANSNKQRRVDSFGDEADLVPAAGHSKKYILVKKKPKHKKIKMEVFEPKMKYKKIKMKIPVMKKKKKKVKGYLVKKEKHHY